ncbi:MAG TPA: dihydroorotate dehydrogenase electron transfer subunit [Candidatus Sulfotelmatobacter sp.]|nr:dihydroorotate dehydrogenase electron transfer subunit [Candidatus Sulfotelmatobacter sp.]
MRATVLTNREFLPRYYLMRLHVPRFPPAFSAGQFVMVRPAAVGDPFLPRPFSLMRSAPTHRAARGGGGGRGLGDGAEIEIVYRALGRGTTLLSTLGRGSVVEAMGPLGGRGFRPTAGPAILVGGGVGIPPLVALAESLAAAPRRGRRPRPPTPDPRPQVLVGGRTKQDVLGVADFRRAGCRVQVATDDGSLGRRGLVTDLLETALGKTGNGNEGRRPTVYACGPEGMLKAVHRIALAADLPCQLSLEANMACGFGGCMGCAIPVRGEGMGAYKLCCKDGPVFDARELRW